MAWMPQKHKDILSEFSLTLCENIDLETCLILHELIQEKIINDTMKEQVMIQPTRHGKVDTLLGILKRRGPQAFPVFLNSLKKDYSFLYVALYSKFVDDEGYDYFDSLYDIKRTMKGIPCKTPKGESDVYDYTVFDYEDLENCVYKPLCGPTILNPNTSMMQPKYESYILLRSVEADVVGNENNTFLEPKEDLDTEIYENDRTVSQKQKEMLHKFDSSTEAKSEEMRNSEVGKETHLGDIETKGSDNAAIDDGKDMLNESITSKGNKNLFVQNSLSTEKNNIEKSKVTDIQNSTSGVAQNLETVDEASTSTYKEEGSVTKVEAISSVKLCEGEVVFGPVIFKTNHDPRIFITVFNKCGLLLAVRKCDVKIYGDPLGEPWYLPFKFVHQQAHDILKNEEAGSFIIYKTPVDNNLIPYQLSLSNGNGTVLTYSISFRDSMLGIDGSNNRRFTTITELVRFYKMNRGPLVCRLWKSPREQMLGLDNSNLLPKSLCIKMKDILFQEITIGKGNFSQVQMGVHKNNSVAVKLQRNTKSKKAEEMFLQEAFILYDLSHTNLVQLVGICIENPQCIILEYMPGGNLLSALTEGKVDLQETAISLCIQLFTALVYLKEQCFVLHRDVAARNCLLDETGTLLKLSDFGLARRVEEDDYIGDSNEKVPVCWSAPEVLLRMQYSTKTDTWAAGVVMWEIWSGGHKPLGGMSRLEQTKHICQGKSLLLEHPNNCTDHVYKLMKECWHLNPKNRPDSKDMIENLTFLFEHKTEEIAVAESDTLSQTSSQDSNFNLFIPPLPKRKMKNKKKFRLFKLK